VGWEVPVVYYDGDPDRPLVLGRLYNADNVVPYGLPGAKATTTLQSATSPGGGSTNEIRMKDDGGGMEMFIHASRDQSVFVGGSATTKVGANKTHDVTLSYALGVKGSESLTVGASQSVNVATDYSTGVKGARSESVGGVEMTKVTANRVVSVKGAYKELVGALYGLQCNQENVDVTGPFSQSVGAALAHAAGLGFTEAVGGARALTVGGARTITAAKGYGETIYGAKVTTAGSGKLKAGTAASTATKGALSTQVGGTIGIEAGALAVFQANQIEITAPSLKAGVLEIGGGTFKITGGTSKLDGTIKRQGGSKVG
jgi:type VI secretion system secreted protein VgrG